MGLYDIQLYELLRARLGEKDASDIMRQLKHPPTGQMPDPRTLVANKEDIAMLKTDIANARASILRWIIFFFVILILLVLGLYF